MSESYPDPVRVISVGADIKEILKDPKSSHWNSFSIELCGGTHLSNTKEAEDFVIIEESGIAKGIRRISGLTRNAATEARKTAQSILTRLEILEKLEGGVELKNASKIIAREVSQFLATESNCYSYL